MTLRQERVQEQLAHEASDLIQKELRDPRLGFVTVTGAEVTRDLRYAKIFVSVLGEEKSRVDSLKALNGAAGMIRAEIAKRIRLRIMPEITFHYDDSLARGQHIFELLHSVEADLRPRPEDLPTEK